MLKVLLDTNVIIDILSKRDGYADSLQVLRCCEARIAEGFVSPITVTNVMYILRKHISEPSVRDSMQTILSIVNLTDVLKGDIVSAFSSGISDYEDAVQSCCASRIRADYIITRNVKDFTNSAVSPILPEEFLKALKK